MIYYQNTGAGNEDIDSIYIEPRKPSEDKAVLLIPEFEFLREFDSKNFNYFNFEHSITDMSDNEFEWWYQNTFKDWLEELNENYIDIDMENVKSMFTIQEEKRVFLLKVVNFAMFLLPYQILRNVQKNLGIEDEHELRDFLDHEENLLTLRSEIIEEIDNNMTQFDDFVKTLLHFEKVAKKNLVEENIELLDDHIKKQNLFLEIFKNIIKDADMFKIKDFILVLLEKDAKNIVR
jgi:hypothetical protein